MVCSDVSCCCEKGLSVIYDMLLVISKRDELLFIFSNACVCFDHRVDWTAHGWMQGMS